ncbi:hypothetical protein Tco_1391965 [Tanacetum coccineum]
MSAGVLMICWPYLWDKLTNCRYISIEWGVGLEMGKDVKREEVQRLVQELMGEGGLKMRIKATNWKEKAIIATSPDGSSSLNVNKLVEEIIIMSTVKHYRIHISQLSVIGAAKVSHFEILCRVHSFEPTTHWKAGMIVSSGSTLLLVLPPFRGTLAPFPKYPEPFLCLIGISRNYTLDEDTYPQFLRDNDEEMDLLSFIRIADPTKVRVGERQRAEGEPKLLDTTVGRVVPLLPVALARASSELEASMEKLFDEGGSGSHAKQGDSVSCGHGVGVSSALQRLLVGAVLNPEVGVAALPTLPFITSSVSVTPEREDGNQSDFMVGANL